MPIPKYFIHERLKALKEREKILGQILAKLGPKNREDDVAEIKMTLEDAVRMIQIHERARQGRFIACIVYTVLQHNVLYVTKMRDNSITFIISKKQLRIFY